MDLPDFLRELQADVRAQLAEGALYPEDVFSDKVMAHMAEIGMTFEPALCRVTCKVGNANLRLSVGGGEPAHKSGCETAFWWLSQKSLDRRRWRGDW